MVKIARRKIALYLADQLQQGASPRLLAQQAVAYLHEAKQMKQFDLLLRDIEVALYENFGEVSVRVTSARDLGETSKTAITTFVREAQDAASASIIDEKVDTDLIGGVVIKTPTRVFDSSVRNQLRQLALSTKE